MDPEKPRLAKEIRENFAAYEGAVSAVDAQMLVLKGAKETYSITKELYANTTDDEENVSQITGFLP